MSVSFMKDETGKSSVILVNYSCKILNYNWKRIVQHNCYIHRPKRLPFVSSNHIRN